MNSNSYLGKTQSPFKKVNHVSRKYGPCTRGRIIILEGHIAAGKSTAGRLIEKYLNAVGIETKFFIEPLIPGLLQLFLSDQKRYAFAFQLAMLVKRQTIYREARAFADQGYCCIIDRSLYGDYCFALMHKNRGNISGNNKLDSDAPNEWKSYMEVLHSEQFQAPDYVIYLKVSPEKAIERCKKRDRSGEKSYDVDYFKELGDIYDVTIPQSPGAGHIELDWNQDKSSDTSEIPESILGRIKKLYDLI